MPCHRRSYASPQTTPGSGETDYAFEMAAFSIRFGAGVTREVGMDFANMKGLKNVLVVKDATVGTLL